MPAGILKTRWLHKHLFERPAVFFNSPLSFFTLSFQVILVLFSSESVRSKEAEVLHSLEAIKVQKKKYQRLAVVVTGDALDDISSFRKRFSFSLSLCFLTFPF